jgi:hypothetical protein
MNDMTGSIPDALCSLYNMQVFDIGSNYFTGTLNTCLASLTQMTNFYVNDNKLNGPIPSSICNLKALNQLMLYSNEFSSTIPTCISNLSSLILLDVRKNNLDGTIPSSLCQCSALKDVSLYGNKLHGTIPSCLATSFPSISTMLLHDNLLSGHLPQEWDLPLLEVLVLSNNKRLEGSIPSSLFSSSHARNTNISSSSPSSSSSSLSYASSVFRSLVLEGTRIRGSIPDAICNAVSLEV